MGDGACQLPGDHSVVCGAQAESGGAGDFKLLRAVFGQKGFGHHARLPQGTQKRLAKEALAAQAMEVVGSWGVRGDAGINEFLLKGGEQGETGLALEIFQGSPQCVAWAVAPGLTFGGLQVADHEQLVQSAVTEFDRYAGGGVGNEEDLTTGAEGGELDGAEGAQEDVGGGEA